MGVVEDLEKLKQLKDNGTITEIEFEIEKQKVLHSNINNRIDIDKNIKIKDNNSLSIASFICSIVSIFILPFIFGIVAIILGIIGISKQEEKKIFSIIGIITGIIGVLWAFYSTELLFF